MSCAYRHLVFSRRIDLWRRCIGCLLLCCAGSTLVRCRPIAPHHPEPPFGPFKPHHRRQGESDTPALPKGAGGNRFSWPQALPRNVKRRGQSTALLTPLSHDWPGCQVHVGNGYIAPLLDPRWSALASLLQKVFIETTSPSHQQIGSGSQHLALWSSVRSVIRYMSQMSEVLAKGKTNTVGLILEAPESAPSSGRSLIEPNTLAV